MSFSMFFPSFALHIQVLEVALTPRGVGAPPGSAPATPRPVMRGPRAQTGTFKETMREGSQRRQDICSTSVLCICFMSS